PAPARARGRVTPGAERRGRAGEAAPAAGAAREGPQRAQGVVGHLARPHQVPERFEHRLHEPAPGGLVEVGEEARAVTSQMLPQAVVDLALRLVGPRRVEQPEVFGEEERDLAVPLAERSDPHPYDLARRTGCVEVGRAVAGD